MISSSIVRILLIGIAASIAATGCANRGQFTKAACDVDKREGVPSGAVLAIYYDLAGNPLPGNPSGTPGEDLKGTKKNKMCPALIEAGPGGCSPKPPWCKVPVNGVNYCVRCP